MAMNVLVDAAPPRAAAAANSAAQSAGVSMHAAIMLARELNVSSALVSPPLGELASTVAMAPVPELAIFPAMPAAFWSPGEVPAIPLALANCAIANPAAAEGAGAMGRAGATSATANTRAAKLVRRRVRGVRGRCTSES